MFELGLDQAHGLKQIFVPSTQGRIHILAISPNKSFGETVIDIGNALTGRGFDVRYQDNEQLLPPINHFNRQTSDGDEIVVSVTRDSGQLVSEQNATTWPLIAAPATPSDLPEVYRAIKMMTLSTDQAFDQAFDTPPITVLWFSDPRGDAELREVCQENLITAVDKHLGKSIEFVNPVSEAKNRQFLNQYTFLDRLSKRLLSSMGRIKHPSMH